MLKLGTGEDNLFALISSTVHADWEQLERRTKGGDDDDDDHVAGRSRANAIWIAIQHASDSLSMANQRERERE